MTLVFSHARKVDARGFVDDFWMVVAGDTIVATGAGTPPGAGERIDVAGRFLTPGFIDIHCHGGGGHTFDGDAESIMAGLRTHRRHGTTRSLVSQVARSSGTLRTQVATVADLAASDSLILGSHLEGPYLSPQRAGAHDPTQLRAPDLEEIRQLIEAGRGTVRMVTIAPELPGALEAIALIADADVIAAIGHTDADFETTVLAFDAGATVLTHAFNAMPEIGHRAPGPVVAAMQDDRVRLELVLDGRHVRPEVARLLFASAPGRVSLITDAMAAAASTDGDYSIGELDVTVTNGLAVITGTATIAGSTLTMDRAVRNAVALEGVSAVDAVTAATHTPARTLGIHERNGLLAVGYAADAVILSDDWSVEEVWTDGLPLPA
jgi:N-acetylglucosamine-6-phosphate deacetylase